MEAWRGYVNDVVKNLEVAAQNMGERKTCKIAAPSADAKHKN
jgi:hypothetical protein